MVVWPHLHLAAWKFDVLNPIQTGLFWTFWDREGGGGGGLRNPPLCDFKTVNVMITKLTRDVDNNSSHSRGFVGMVTLYDVIYPILLAEKLFNQYFLTIRCITTKS